MTEEEKRLTRLYNEVFRSDAGVEVLYHIYHTLCAYDASYLLSEVDQGRRIVYAYMRKFLSKELKAKVEIVKEPKPVESPKKSEPHPYVKNRSRNRGDNT